MVICSVDGCSTKKTAYYGYDYKVAIACSECRKKPENAKMVNVVDKRCIVCLITRATIRFPGKPVSHCNAHRLPGMEGNSKKCVDCKKVSVCYGLPNKPMTHCANCKTPEMESVAKKCIVCKTIGAGYGLEADKIKTHCTTCKTPEMINLIDKMCETCNNVIAHYGYTSKTHCVSCKEPDMFNVFGKLCIVCNIKQPNFSKTKEERPTHCGDCKTPEMDNFITKRCEVCEIKYPHFGYLGEYRTHCFNCKLPGMLNIAQRKCKSINCDISYSNPQYNGYCLNCFKFEYPDSEISRNQKTKELAVGVDVANEFKNLKIIFDKIIENGNSLRRPDMFINMGDFIIITEIDENQHTTKKYLSTNESRTIEIIEAINHKPLVLIRFNPDKYYDKNNNKIKSCWKINKDTGILEIVNIDDWNNRLKKLKETIQYYIDNGFTGSIEIVPLFYDENIDENIDENQVDIEFDNLTL